MFNRTLWQGRTSDRLPLRSSRAGKGRRPQSGRGIRRQRRAGERSLLGNLSRFHFAIAAAAAAIPLLLLLAPVARPDAPRVFAIKDARIVTGTGSVISKGIVVFRDGLITDVGENVAIPGDARQIDGSGLTVYPGLIDAFTTLGLPATALAQERPAFGGFNPEAIRAAAAATPERAEQVHGERWLSAANEVKPEGAPIQEARIAGITTALSSPTRGIFAGESAVVDLAGESGGDMVVRSPVALTVQFTTSRGFFGIFPNSLMGSVAFIRQSFYDAIYYRDELARYDRVKQGVPRPDYDRKSETLLPALKGDLPVLFVATSDLDIRRALMIAHEFKLKPIIEGAIDGYRVADMLASEKVPVILSVDYPKRAANLPEDVDEPLDTLIERAEAPTCAGRLAKAGVQFAFSSGKLKPAEFVANVRQAIESGLSADDALKALTGNAAQILGVADHLGAIEKGKVANLIVTKGDLFARDTKIDNVFIDGNEIDMTPPEAPQGPGAAAGPGYGGRPGFGGGRPGGAGPRPGPAGGRAPAAGPQQPLPPLDIKELDQAMLPYTGPQSNELLIKNATIMTASHGTIKNGSILVKDGKIAAVGTDVTSSDPGVRVIDATGRYVTPGIIDTHSHTAIEGGVNEGTLSVTSMCRIRDVINPYDADIYRELAGGTTTVNMLHGSANSIGGQNAVVKLKMGKPVDQWIIPDAPAGIKFALGENPKRSNFNIPGTPRRYPATRMGVEETIRSAFDRAKDYKRKWDEYEAKKATDPNAIPPRRDLSLDPIVEILQGKRYIHSHCYRDDEILMLLNLGDELGFHVQLLHHVLEGYKVAKEIAAHHTGASTFADFWSYKMEAYDAIPYNAAMMAKKGVIVTVDSDSDERARRLYLEAAKTMKYGGLSEEEALRTVTLNGAIQLGIDKRTGSIDVGKDADLVIFSQHPFSVYTVPLMTIIEGQIYFDRSEDIARRESLKRLKAELIKREKAERAPRRGPAEMRERPEPAPRPQDEARATRRESAAGKQSIGGGWQ